MDFANWIALISVVASVASAIAASVSSLLAKQAINDNQRATAQTLKVASLSNEIADKALALDKDVAKREENMYKREHVFELHKVWDGIHAISSTSPNTVDAHRGASALALTALVWLHDVMDRHILHQSYRDMYVELYDSLNNITNDLPGTNRSGRELLSNSMTSVYNEMKRMDDELVRKSKIFP